MYAFIIGHLMAQRSFPSNVSIMCRIVIKSAPHVCGMILYVITKARQEKRVISPSGSMNNGG